jgi:hypothetical protein
MAIMMLLNIADSGGRMRALGAMLLAIFCAFSPSEECSSGQRGAGL